MMISTLLVITAFSHSFSPSSADAGCKKIGGSCLDWRHHKCIAGYQTGLCSGDKNRRCCKPCDDACTKKEASYGDSKCKSKGGTCMDNSNYCTESYLSGHCGGPAGRQCCTKKSAASSADSACTSISGNCLDWRHHKCIGGYEAGFCSGDINRRCCKPCDDACTRKEASYSDSKCKSKGGTCTDNSNYCAKSYISGHCGGPAGRQCCTKNVAGGKGMIGGGGCKSMAYGNIKKVDTTGASSATARQDNLIVAGVSASHKMAETDSNEMAKYKSLIEKAGCQLAMDPAIIAGIISRETRAGKALYGKAYGADGHGYGLMQVDDRYHTIRGGPYSLEHILQGTEILIGMISGVDSKHPTWSQNQVLKGGISAYNAGVGNVDTYDKMDVGTTGNDYGNDVAARSQYYSSNGY